MLGNTISSRLLIRHAKQPQPQPPKGLEPSIERGDLVVERHCQRSEPCVSPEIRRGLPAGYKRDKAALVCGRLGFNVNRARIVPKLAPSPEGFSRRDRDAIHGDSVGQQTQDREARQQARAYSSVRLLIPPTSSHFMRDVTLNQQRKENVSVRDTRH